MVTQLRNRPLPGPRIHTQQCFPIRRNIKGMDHRARTVSPSGEWGNSLPTRFPNPFRVPLEANGETKGETLLSLIPTASPSLAGEDASSSLPLKESLLPAALPSSTSTIRVIPFAQTSLRPCPSQTGRGLTKTSLCSTVL